MGGLWYYPSRKRLLRRVRGGEPLRFVCCTTGECDVNASGARRLDGSTYRASRGCRGGREPSASSSRSRSAAPSGSARATAARRPSRCRCPCPPPGGRRRYRRRNAPTRPANATDDIGHRGIWAGLTIANTHRYFDRLSGWKNNFVFNARMPLCHSAIASS